MKSVLFLSANAALALVMVAGPASAETMARATTDLNIRSGPGPQHEVIGLIGASEEATLGGCLSDSKWCRVTYDGTEGWAYSDYLQGTFAESQEPVVLSEWPTEARPVATYESPTTVTVTTGSTTGTDDGSGGASAGAATGAVAGALIGGPVGAVVGGVAGAVVGGTADAATPPEEVVTYVRENQVDPIYLDGEVVVGAGIPENVELREIPGYDYQYVYVNGLPVVVEPGDRVIVQVVR